MARNFFYLGNSWNALDFNGSAFETTHFQSDSGIIKLKPGSISDADVAATAQIARTKIAPVTPATAGNLAMLTAAGDIQDSGTPATSLSVRSPVAIPVGTYTSLLALITAKGAGYWFVAQADSTSYTDLPLSWNSTGGIFLEALGSGTSFQLTLYGNTSLLWTAHVNLPTAITWVRSDISAAYNSTTITDASSYTSLISLINAKGAGRWRLDNSVSSYSAYTDLPLGWNTTGVLVMEVVGSEGLLGGRKYVYVYSVLDNVITWESSVDANGVVPLKWTRSKNNPVNVSAVGADLLATLQALSVYGQEVSGIVTVDATTTNQPCTFRTIAAPVTLAYVLIFNDGAMMISSLGAIGASNGWAGSWKYANSLWARIDTDWVYDAVYTGTTFLDLIKNAYPYNGTFNIPGSITTNLTDVPVQLVGEAIVVDIKGSSGIKFVTITGYIDKSIVYITTINLSSTTALNWARLNYDPHTMLDYPISITAGDYTSVSDLVTTLGNGFYYITAADFVNYTDRPSDFTYTTGAFVRAVGFGNPTTPNGVTIELTINNATNAKWMAYLTGVSLSGWDKVLTASTSLIGNIVGPPDQAHMENVNRITANNGSWTSDRDGYVKMLFDNQAEVTIRFNRNGAAVDGIFGASLLRIIEVRKGDTVQISIAGSISTARNFQCYFIPAFPAITGVPTANNLVTLGPPDYANYVVKAQAVSGDKSGFSWIADADGYIRVAVDITTAASKGGLYGVVMLRINNMPFELLYIPTTDSTGTYYSTKDNYFQVKKGDLISVTQEGTLATWGWASNLPTIAFIPPTVTPPVYLQSASVINYSTAEQDTGIKWLDGRTIYQKSVNWTGAFTATTSLVGNVADIIPGATMLAGATEAVAISGPSLGFYQAIQAIIDGTGVELRIKGFEAISSRNWVITFRYVK